MKGSPFIRLGWIFGLLGIAVPVSLSVALKRIRGPKTLFQQVSIFCDGDCDKRLAEELARADVQSGLHRAHIEMIGLTLVALALLCFLFSRKGIPTWTQYVLTTAAAASLAACWWQW